MRLMERSRAVRAAVLFAALLVLTVLSWVLWAAADLPLRELAALFGTATVWAAVLVPYFAWEDRERDRS